jgi:hypothetical protein
MSIQAPQGILNIPNATLRVGKLAVDEVVGADTILNTVARNTILLVDDEAYHENKNWALKLPNAWAGEFECNTASAGNYSEFNFYNEGASSNVQGYNLTFNDTAVELRYDGTLLKTGTLASTITGTGVKKVRLMFERTILSVTVDGTLVFTHDDTVGPRPRVYSTTAGGFLNFFTDGGALKNLKIVNEKWMSDGTSNIAYVGGGEVAVGQALAFNRVSNVSQIKVDSNVVTEYTGPHDRPLRKYPEVLSPGTGLVPVSVTTPFTGLKQSWNGYEIIMSSRWDTSGEYNGDHAFDDNESSIWLSGNSPATYDSNGDATSEDTLDGVDGSYLIMKLPKAIKPSYANIKTRAANDFAPRHPKTGKFYGSNDGSSWTEIGTFSYGSIPSSVYYQKFNLVGTNTYQYIAIQVHTVFNDSGPSDGTTNGVVILDLQYYGHEEGSGSIDTTLKSVYNVPATTGTQLEVYYDAKDLADGAVTSIEDLSPKSNDGSPTDVSVSDGAFVFNGTSSLMEKTSLSIPGSDNPFTISFWLKNDDFDSNQYILRLGINQTIYQTVAIYKNSSNQIIFASWTLDFPIDYTFTTNQWNHISLVYPGGGWKQSNLIAYIDGRPYTFGGNVSSGGVGGTVLSLATSLTLRLGGFAAGNTHLDGSIANFRLYSKALNADQVKELYDYQKDYFLGSKSQVTLYKGHLGIGVTEPSGQLELAGDERLQEYPPGPMDDYETLIPGHGVFCVSASSQYNSSYAPWKAFRKFWDTDDQSWASFNETVTKETGLPSSTAANFQGILGNWIQLKLPYKIDLHSFKFESRDNVNYAPEELPGAGIVYGSNDEVTWDIVHSFSGVDYGGVSGTLRPVFTVKSNTSYSIFRLLVTKNYLTRSDLRWAGMGAWRLFGTPGPTTLDKGSLSLTRSLNVPRVSRYDVDTETPRPEKLVVDFDTTVNSSPTDISGKGNHGTFVNGASYSPADKAFVFDGTDDVIYTSSATSLPTGDAIYSISAWIKYEGTTGIGVNPVIFAFGSLWDNNKIGNLFLRDGNKLGSDIGGNNIVSTDTVITTNRWYHVVACKVGTENLTTDKIRLYVDGVEIIDKSMNGTSITQALGTSVYVSVGAGFNSQTSPTSPFTGKVSNPKLYNVALEPSEVKKLYNLGRTGRSMVISDTAVGIGKVPEAQLDVRGNLAVRGDIQSSGPNFEITSSGFVGIGKNPGHLLDVNGTMRANLNYSPQNWAFYDTIGSDTAWRTAFSVGSTAIGFFSVLSYNAGFSQSNAIWYYQYKSGGTSGGVVRITGSSSPTFRMTGQTVEHNGNGGTHFTQLRVLPFII